MYRDQWDDAAAPSLESMAGRHRVKMLTGGVLKLLNVVGNVKEIHGEAGHNLLAGRFKWGGFYLVQCVTHLRLVYEKHGITDRIRRINQHKCLGRFERHGEFKAWFSLEKE